VTLSGTGEYVIVSALAALAERGLVHVADRPDGPDPILQRQQLLAALEGREVPRAAERPVPPARVAPEGDRQPVIPERPEPFTPERQPDFAEEPLPALARLAASPTASAPASATASVGAVEGAHALKPETAPAAVPGHAGLIDRDPSVNKSLLLRLIAGVRGL